MLTRSGLAALSVALCAIFPGAASAATNLGAYWPLNESTGTAVQDVSANANAGVISGGAAHVPGRFDRALHFDGVDSQVLVARSPSLEPASITVEAWVRAPTSPGSFRYVMSNGANGCLVPSYGLYTGAGGGLAFVVSAGEESNFTASPNVGAGVWDGAWHHVAGTFDGATVRLYVDGTQVGTGTAATLPIAYGLPTSTATLLGAFGGGPCPAGDGQLRYAGDVDEPHVWRRALSAQEIAAGAAMAGPRTTDLRSSITTSQAILYTSDFSDGSNIAVSIESSTDTERIAQIRISQLLPIGTGVGCGGGLLLSPCAITLSNGGRTATLSVTRRSFDGVVTLNVDLASGRRLYVDVAG
jgi:hypothetical protein